MVIKILFRLLFRNYLSLEIGEVLHLKNTWMIFTQECVVPSLVEIVPVVLEKIFKFVQRILVFLFVNISPLKRAGPFIWMNVRPYQQRMHCAKFGWNLARGSREENENVKSLRQRRWRRTTDKFWSEKLTWAFDSGELKTKIHIH